MLDFLALIEILSTKLDQNELAEMAVIMRKIWFRRNAIIYDGMFMHPTVLVEQAVAQLQEFQAVRGELMTQSSRISIDQHQWLPLESNWFKVNWDVAVDKSQNQIGIGVVVRDY